MALLLIVEDSPKDLDSAASVAKRAGFSEIKTRILASLAIVYLEKALQGESPLPDAILLDLDLGLESGFELLRFCHKTKLLSRIPVVVWTIMGEEHREICKLFGVRDCLSKNDGPAALHNVLARISGMRDSNAGSG